MFHACDLVHVLSMEFRPYTLFKCILNIFSFEIFPECLRRQEIELLKRELGL